MKQLLENNRVYPIGDIRNKFQGKFPSIKTIIAIDRLSGRSRDFLIDKAPRPDIIAEYIDEITQKGLLVNELRGIKKETETRLGAAAPASANFPPVGVGG